MPGALEAAGASPDGTKYAPLTMDRYFTGMATQRNPLRDADVPYLQAKFYGASRYDSILDGLNTELTAELTLARRAGQTVYNSATFAQGYGTPYSFQWLQDGLDKIQVFSANATEVDDITTSGSKVNIWSKSAGAGPTRYQGVGNTLYFADGKNVKQYLRPNTHWTSATAYSPGQLILDTNGNLQQVQSTEVPLTITSVKTVSRTILGSTVYYTYVTFSSPAPTYGFPYFSVNFAGLTNFTSLNEQNILPVPTQIIQLYGLAPTADQLVFTFGTAVYGPVSDTGTGTLITTIIAPGVSGTSQPSWNAALGGYTTDNVLTWRNFGAPTLNVGLPVPIAAPSLAILGSSWIPSTNFAQFYTILDQNGNYQSIFNGPGYTGGTLPTWGSLLNSLTTDGNVTWLCVGPAGVWAGNTNFVGQALLAGNTPTDGLLSSFIAIIDSNGNLQVAQAVTGPTGGTEPTWNATFTGTTTDGGTTWRNIGPGRPATYFPFSYAYSFHSIDGSVSTASPLAQVYTAILTQNGSFTVVVTGQNTTDAQCDQIWLWRTPQNTTTLIFDSSIVNPQVGSGSPTSWNIDDSTPDANLNAFIAAPIAGTANPPPSTLTAPVFYLGRMWGIVGNLVQYSNGANTGTGNGLTQFPALNFDTCAERPVRLLPITITGGGLLVQSTLNLYIIMGSGTSSDPFLPMKLYMGGIGVRNYDAMCMIGSTLYAYTIQRKFISLDPSAGYVECGFFIGDQFEKMTTGGYDQVMFDPNYTSVVWHERNSGDSAIYIIDGSPTGGVGWFRYSPVATPESGFMWSPFAAITGGVSGVASIEVSPGDIEMVVMPGTAGPALKRDTSVNSDNGTTYVPYTTIGNIVLCPSGEIAEVAWVTLVSKAIGTQATVGLLFDEIAETTDVTFETLEVTSYDPPDLASIPSETLYSDRYVAMQNEECPKCVSVQMKVVWIAEDEANELLTHTIVGARYEERKQQ